MFIALDNHHFLSAVNLTLRLNLSLSMPCQNIGGAEIQLHPFSISALDGDGWLNSRPVRFTPTKNSVPCEWTPERVWTFWRRVSFLVLPRFEHSTVQPVASRYTDYAVNNLIMFILSRVIIVGEL